jgi:hypothetical protein
MVIVQRKKKMHASIGVLIHKDAMPCRNAMGSKLVGKLRMACGPKYDGKYLHAQLRRLLGNMRLDRTLTNVVIPTFDIAYMQPMIFSSFEVGNSLKYQTSSPGVSTDFVFENTNSVWILGIEFYFFQ